MSDKIEYSRLILKRSDVSGVTPTVTSATTLNEFTETDLFSGEMFLNTIDERAFVRMNNNILEFDLVSSGGTDYNFCDTGIQTSAISGCTPVDIYDNLNFQSQKNITTSNGSGEISLDTDGFSDSMSIGVSAATYQDYLRIDPNGNLGDGNGTELASTDFTDTTSIVVNPNFLNIYMRDTDELLYTDFTMSTSVGKSGSQAEVILGGSDGTSDGTFGIDGSSNGVSGVSRLNFAAKEYFFTTDPDRDIIFSNGLNMDCQLDSQTVNFFNGDADNTQINIGKPNGSISLSADTSVTGDLTMTTGKGIKFGNGVTRVFVEIEIGDWDMDTTASVNVSHVLSLTEWKTIRQIDVIIRNDGDTGYYPLRKGYDGVTGNGFVNVIGSTNITLNRVTGGDFDNVNFDSTSYNRGWITFWYKPD